MSPVWGVVHNHDREAFEVHLFADNPPSDQYRSHPTDQVHDTSGLDNDELAALIDASGVDIVVDLNAYSTPLRLGVWASPVRPVAIVWFNMHTTVGLEAFDYLIGDEVVAPAGYEQYCAEALLRVPPSYLTFTVSYEAPPLVDPPFTRRGSITFGSMATMYKISDQLIAAWARIMHAVPEASLLVGNADLSSRENRRYLLARLERGGIDADRIELRGRAPHNEFLGYYNDVDIALDTFPYSGGTTTNEALWQGVPVITQLGDRWVTRTSASLLTAAGLVDFIGADEDDYVARAVALAARPDELVGMRRSQRARVAASRACDSVALTRSIEDLYRGVLTR
jgi:predicted O-linked N-acetylglucosamine transferase (SPINDLY family)